ncbi:hypothetical protein, partial [Caldifermentibacillus hisashii]|uniref:hypothetical protein n=1 Tax=Caldifermentibacillus hisashii TaxID=996558 RepID=UPI001C11F6F0
YHKKFPPNANILGFLHTLIITYLAKFGWNYLEEFLLFRAGGENQLEPKHKMTVFNKTNVNDNKYSKKTPD